jgi:hypothetical protein
MVMMNAFPYSFWLVVLVCASPLDICDGTCLKSLFNMNFYSVFLLDLWEVQQLKFKMWKKILGGWGGGPGQSLGGSTPDRRGVWKQLLLERWRSKVHYADSKEEAHHWENNERLRHDLRKSETNRTSIFSDHKKSDASNVTGRPSGVQYSKSL